MYELFSQSIEISFTIYIKLTHIYATLVALLSMETDEEMTNAYSCVSHHIKIDFKYS